MTLKLYASLSEAIRAGAKITPRGQAGLWLDEHGGTCALGAGAAAIGLPMTPNGDGLWAEVEELYPYIVDRATCPISGERDAIQYIIAALFDSYDWTREAIADWLETEEEKIGFVTVYETEPVNEMTLGAEQMERKDAVSASPLTLSFQER